MADSPKLFVIVEGRRRQVIRRYEHGTEVWPASLAEITRDRGADTLRVRGGLRSRTGVAADVRPQLPYIRQCGILII